MHEPQDPTLTYRGAVYPWHCDHMGHMNVMWYTGKFDEASWQFFAALGLTRDWLLAQGRGMAAVEQLTEYRRELHAGDLLSIRTRLLELRPKGLRLRHEMFRAGGAEPVAVSTLAAVFLDTAARRACAFPEELSRRWQGDHLRQPA